MTDTLRVVLPTGEVIDQEIPQPPPIDWAVPDSPELDALFAHLVGRAWKRLERRGGLRSWSDQHAHAPRSQEELVTLVRTLLVDPNPPTPEPIPELRHLPLGEAAPSVLLTPTGLVKLAVASGQLAGEYYQLLPVLDEFTTQHQVTGRPTLLEVASLLDHCGYDGADVVMYGYMEYSVGHDWADDAVWPFFAGHLEKLLAYQERLAKRRDSSGEFFQALRTFPALPERVIDKLYELAFGPREADRFCAQKLLRQHPDRTRRATAALDDRKRDVRVLATKWLAQIQDPEAVPALERALAKERQPDARSAMKGALLTLGQSVAHVVTVEERNRTAAKPIKIPKAVEWFRWDALPTVRLATTNEPVPHDTLTWLIVEAVKRKSPEPDESLRAYCRMFRDDDRERLGRFVLEAWLDEDLGRLPSELSVDEARQQAIDLHQRMTAHRAAYRGHSWLDLTVDEMTQRLLWRRSPHPGNPGVSSRGLLAVVAACAGPDVVPEVKKYLMWYGQRVPQCTALVAMLSCIEHPLAEQLLLSVANRIDWDAPRVAQALARRRGRSMADLVDRTVPTAGFDENGQLQLSYGSRVFTATLTPGLTVELRNPDGKTITSLPPPRGSDDKQQAEAAKQRLAAVKKELELIAGHQTARLYDAMCTGRKWAVSDWRTYLAEHPVMRHLVRRLVWIATWQPDRAVSFRPLEDGSLTDVDDNEVTVPEDGTISLAHDVWLSADEAEAWLRHFADYEVAPLFPQLDKKAFRLAPQQRHALVIKDFEGRRVAASTLHERAKMLGYFRAWRSEDGDTFYHYRKRFPRGITAVIRFSGSSLVSETNRIVDLEELVFVDAERERPVPLGTVPAVVLSEAWNDMRLIAETATT